jgi:hypothetical protein
MYAVFLIGCQLMFQRCAAFIIALMMEAACTSKTSVDIQLRTRQYIPEDSELHTLRRENLKSHEVFLFELACLTSYDGNTQKKEFPLK